MIFSFFLFRFLGILGPPYCGIGATIRIGREMLCLPYVGFLLNIFVLTMVWMAPPQKSVLETDIGRNVLPA